MNIFKRLVSIILCFLMCLIVVSCAGKEQQNTTKNETTEITETEKTTTEQTTMAVTETEDPIESAYAEALLLYESGNYAEALDVFKSLGNYKDSADWISKCETALEEKNYTTALSLIESKEYVEAYELLISLNGYKDSAEKAKEIYEKYRAEKIRNANVGDIVLFGDYEQDADDTNGKEEIEWLVLAKEDNKVLLISRYALDCKPFDRIRKMASWRECTLNKWLNEEFINEAFSADEQRYIQETNIDDYALGQYVTCNIFLLSVKEAEAYFESDEARKCEPTEYAKSQGAYTFQDFKTTSWWLRFHGYTYEQAAFVGITGFVDKYGAEIYYPNVAVRPALWIVFNT